MYSPGRGRLSASSSAPRHRAPFASVHGGLFALLMLVSGVAFLSSACASEKAVELPPPTLDNPKSAGPMQTAVLAGGCFWGVQAVFQHVGGVRNAVSGYAGGEQSTAKYRTVGTGRTGHAESVQITFDPAKVSYGELLQVFFSVAHDPTQLNRQGPDRGPQYRSAIFYANDKQRQIATAYVEQLSKAKVFPQEIVTKIDPLDGFFAAEDYHQDYLVKHPKSPYIVINDLPKLRNLERTFPAKYRDEPVTTARIDR